MGYSILKGVFDLLDNHYWKRLQVCIVLFTKRLLKKPSFIILLLILPCFSFGLQHVVSTTKISLQIGLYTDDTDGDYDDLIIRQLTEQSEGLQFVLYDSKEALLNAVRTRGVDCAFVFPEYFSSDLEQEDKNRTLFCYTSPASATTAIAKEYIHSEIFAIYAYEKMIDYIYKDCVQDQPFREQDTYLDQLNRELTPIYTSYLNGPDTFRFTYVQPDDTIIDTKMVLPSYILGSVKGIAAIFILAGAFMGTLQLYQDKKNRLFLAFSRNCGILAQFFDILIPTLFIGISGLLTVWICDSFTFTSIFTTLLYCIICVLYCALLHVMIPSKRTFISIIPVILIGSLIFCPIIVDFSALAPAIRPIRWCFPPQYFI